MTDDTATRVAASGVDLWDTTAQLESRGISDPVARARGYSSVFDYARTLRADTERVIVPGHTHRGSISVGRGIQRSLVLLAGVLICWSSIPPGATETVVFALAASGWLAGQGVSAAIWHTWGVRNDKGEGIRMGLAVAAAVLLIAVVGWSIRGVPEGLIWVGWCAATPLLLVVCAPWILAGVSLIAGGLCLLAWAARAGLPWSPAALAGIGLPVSWTATAAALVVAAVLGVRAAQGWRPSRCPGTLGSVLAALAQATFQLALLLSLFVGLGPAAFGAIAIAGLVVGFVADPLYTWAQANTRSIAERFTSWRSAQIKIAIPWVLISAFLMMVAAAVVLIALSDPYAVFLNERTVVAGAVLVGAVIAGTNILLRSGSVVGSMLFALVAELLTVWTVWLPSDEPSGFIAIAAIAGVMGLAALVLASERFSRPLTW